MLQEVALYFPQSAHIAALELTHLSDYKIWQYAKENDFIIVTKDRDFYHLATAKGHPPKVVWLTAGNCTNRQLIEFLLHHTKEIISFIEGSESILILQ